MGFTRRAIIASAAAMSLLLGHPAAAQDKDHVTVGVLTDMSGIFSDITGEGSVLAAKMAIDAFGGEVAGRPIRLLVGDHLHKPEVGSNIARQWIDEENIDAIVDLPNSSVLLAVVEVARDKGHAVILAAGGQTSRFANEACSSFGFQWVTNSYATAHGLAGLATEEGARKWFLIQPDYAYGDAVAKDISAAVTDVGGEIVGLIKHPLNTSDYASYILQAQASGADVIALLNSGADLVNALKQTAEFGVTQKLVTSNLYPITARAVGLDTVKGLISSDGYYWNQSEEAAKWSAEFMSRHSKGQAPSAVQIGVYSAVTHFLKAFEAAETKDRDGISNAMRALPVNDQFVSDGIARADGLMVHDMLLMQAKAPDEAASGWDVFNILRRIPGDQAYADLSTSLCPLVK
ncbi:ABC transporter substrate-binding protein [Actibacterium sp. D379-3]